MLEHLNEPSAKPKRVIVMGAGGFVGGAIVDRLEAQGISVLALTRKEVNLLDGGAERKLADMIEPEDAFVAVSALAPAKDADMMIDNLVMARAMVSALKARADDISHVVNISSDAVFADGPVPLNEDTPTAPGSYHGVMHLAREILFETEIDAPLAILRPTLIYGTKDPHNGYGPNRFRRLAAEGHEIVLFGEGEERRDHVLVDDVAEIVCLTLTHRSRGSLNVATGAVTSFREIAEMVVTHFENPVSIKGSPRSGPMPHNGYRPFDIMACGEAFPDFRFTALEDGLAKIHQETQFLAD